MLRRIPLAIAFVVFLSSERVLGSDSLTLYMTEIPGQTMNDDSNLGMAREIAHEAAMLAGIALNETFVPWARAVKAVEKSANTVIIPFSRTPTREKRFTWIAVLYPLQFGFVSLNKPINSFDHARRLKRIGVWRATSMEEELRQAGFKNIAPVSDDKALARMLVKGRFDAWYGSLVEAAYQFRGIKEINRAKLQFGEPLREQKVWLASGLKISGQIVGRLRGAMKTLEQSGAIRSIIRKYGFDPK